MPPGHSSLPSLRRTWLTLLAALAAALPGHAQDAPPEGLSGQLGVAYAFALNASGPPPLAGPIVRADLAFRVGERHLTLTVDPVSLDRLDVAFEVREGGNLLSATVGREPAAGDAPGRGDRTDVQVLAVRRSDAGPTLQALVNGQWIAGPQGSATMLGRLALSDRLRDPGWGLSSFDWRASVQLLQVDVAAAAISRTTTTLAFGVGGALGGPNRRSWRPSLGFETSFDGADAGAGRTRLDLGLAADVTPVETLTLRWRTELDRPAGGGAARTAQQQRLSLRSQRFAAVRMTGEIDRRASLAGETSWGWSAGVEAPVLERWTLGVTYRGEAAAGASEHGARVRVGVQSATTGATLRANVEGGALWRTSDGWRPDATVSLAAALRGDGPLTGNLTGSLRYDGDWAGNVAAEAGLDLGRADLAVTADLTLADATALGATARLGIDVLDAVAIQFGVDARTTLGDGSSASVDLGLRYRFGGER
jgi:hypothetical protein